MFAIVMPIMTTNAPITVYMACVSRRKPKNANITLRTGRESGISDE